jgi:hypothetical protein
MSATRTVQRPRGQASVELALGLLAFITVLIFGIHFAEVQYLAVRVATATHSAIFRLTGQRAHEAGHDFKLVNQNVAGLNTMHHRKYWNDFTPNTGEGSAAVSNVLTKIEKTEANLVRCFNEDELQSDLKYIPMIPKAFSETGGGIRCGGQGTVSILPVFPKNFLDNNWGLKTAHYSGPTSFRVCATARNQRGGPCGQIPVLLGDYSLQGNSSRGPQGPESKSHDLMNGGNDAFEDLTKRAFGTGGKSPMCLASGMMMLSLKLLPQVGPCNSELSFKGHEAGLRQRMDGHETRGPWPTAGYKGTLRAKDNKAHYLGVNR